MVIRIDQTIPIIPRITMITMVTMPQTVSITMVLSTIAASPRTVHTAACMNPTPKIIAETIKMATQVTPVYSNFMIQEMKKITLSLRETPVMDTHFSRS